MKSLINYNTHDYNLLQGMASANLKRLFDLFVFLASFGWCFDCNSSDAILHNIYLRMRTVEHRHSLALPDPTLKTRGWGQATN